MRAVCLLVPETHRWSVLGKHRSRRLVTLFPRRRSLLLLRLLLPSPPAASSFSSPSSIPLPLVCSVSKLRRENDAGAARSRSPSFSLSLSPVLSLSLSQRGIWPAFKKANGRASLGSLIPPLQPNTPLFWLLSPALPHHHHPTKNTEPRQPA